eukprot:CAMPEP_0119276232 /NCGR_PEP_ID=MMETSP1329-20130426/15091_1 /TAXON_ID=114041 /ORGANISM="Genus nov. species nov., Strain RCC1024" /LENGTH=179 /DNA_ID=CAMNT_0007276659 /DNA_START=34 /DNA_END=573 /DNA_ORIENTATION=+
MSNKLLLALALANGAFASTVIEIIGGTCSSWGGGAGYEMLSASACESYTLSESPCDWGGTGGTLKPGCYKTTTGNPFSPSCTISYNSNTASTGPYTPYSLGHPGYCQPASPPAPTPEPTSFQEETCGGIELHRFPDLESCCDDLAEPDYQDQLTDFLEGLTGADLTTFTTKCSAHFSGP